VARRPPLPPRTAGRRSPYSSSIHRPSHREPAQRLHRSPAFRHPYAEHRPALAAAHRQGRRHHRDGRGLTDRLARSKQHGPFWEGPRAGSSYWQALAAWAADLKIGLEIVRKRDARAFEVLPRRWVVERTLAWITAYRRCARDYELPPDIGITFSLESALGIGKVMDDAVRDRLVSTLDDVRFRGRGEDGPMSC